MSPSPVERFSDRAGYYTRYRPDYPRAVVELLAGEAGLTAHAVIVDIGSGTGLSSRLFLDAGYTVYGVEPNAAMRACCQLICRVASKKAASFGFEPGHPPSI